MKKQKSAPQDTNPQRKTQRKTSNIADPSQKSRLTTEEVSHTNSDLENLIDASKTAILLLDSELRIKRLTSGVEAFFNIRPSDRGRPIGDFAHDLGYPDLVKDATQVLREQVPLQYESANPNGCWMLIRLGPYRMTDNSVKGVVISFVDITQVKKTERVRQNYESFYTLFHANPIPTMLTRLKDNVVINVNQAFLNLIGLRREEVVGHTAQEFNLGLDITSKRRAELTTQLLKKGDIRNFEERIKLPSGEEKTILTSLQYIYIEETDTIVSNFIDISERVQAEQRIRQLTIELTAVEQEERSRLSQILHDDLQQRIFAVKMQVENMQEALDLKDLQSVKSDYAKLEEWLIEAIKITRQLSTHLSPLGLKGEDLSDVIIWLTSQMKEQYGLEVELDTNNVHVKFDQNLLMVLFRAIRELLFNVVKYAGTLEAKVTLRQVDSERVYICVSDEGAGFDSLTVLGDSNYAHGLANVQQRLLLFGCNMEVASAVGRGTCVTIDCPMDGQVS
jgi:PAS domain S-box-containing protein